MMMRHHTPPQKSSPKSTYITTFRVITWFIAVLTSFDTNRADYNTLATPHLSRLNKELWRVKRFSFVSH
jgi:hypothetical protein